jgi:Tfp pilus assembly protein PilO
MGALLEELDRLMTQRDVDLVKIEPRPTMAERSYRRTPIRMVFSGEFDGIHRFLDDLETMQRVVTMDEMTVTRDAASEACRVALTLSFFER